MKKLVLSVTLGMFCYCTNNATMSPKTTKPIDDLLNKMIIYQNVIFRFKEKRKGLKGKIYFAIKGKEEKINKKNVLDFIKKHFINEHPTRENFDNDDINKIEQYFHLDKLQPTDECKEENLTETFWTAPENKLEEQGTLTNEDKNSIKDYFSAIIQMEKNTSEDFKEYYEKKKKEEQDDNILKEIMNDCCGDEEKGDIVTNFIKNLEKKISKNSDQELKKYILTTIKKRITLSNDTAEEEKDFISFLKQKIEEGKKEKEKKKEQLKKFQLAEEESPCCNC